MSSIKQYPSSVRDILEVADAARNMAVQEMTLQHIDDITLQVIRLVLQWQGFTRSKGLAASLQMDVSNQLLDNVELEEIAVPKIRVQEAEASSLAPSSSLSISKPRKSTNVPTRTRNTLIRQSRTLLRNALTQAAEQIAQSLGYMQEGVGQKIAALIEQRLADWREESFEFPPAIESAFVVEWEPTLQKPGKAPNTKIWTIKPGRYRFIDETIKSPAFDFSIGTNDVVLPEQTEDVLLDTAPVLPAQPLSELQSTTAFSFVESTPVSFHGHSEKPSLLSATPAITPVSDMILSKRSSSELQAHSFSIDPVMPATPEQAFAPFVAMGMGKRLQLVNAIKRKLSLTSTLQSCVHTVVTCLEEVLSVTSVGPEQVIDTLQTLSNTCHFPCIGQASLLSADALLPLLRKSPEEPETAPKETPTV